MPTENPKVLLTLTAAALSDLDQLAAERAEPDQQPNRSEAVRFLLREHRKRAGVFCEKCGFVTGACQCRPARTAKQRKTDRTADLNRKDRQP
jgi:hypothetical protein